MPLIEFRDPDGELRQRQFSERLIVGRANESDLQLLDDLVSKRHLEFVAEPGGLTVTDLGSRNGTWINGRRVTGKERLNVGDAVKVGRVILEVKAVDAASTVPRAAPQPEPSPEEVSEKERKAARALRMARRASSMMETSTPQASDQTTPGRTPSGRREGTRVMIFDSDQSSPIQSKVRGNDSATFLPADEVTDPDVLRRDYEKLRIASELSRALSSDLELDRLLERTINIALDVFHAERGTILLYPTGSDELQPAAVASRNPDANDDELRVSRTLLKQVVDERTAVLSSDAMMDQRFNRAHSIVLAGIRSIMLVPLLAEEELLGVIHLDSRVSTDMFTEKDLHLLTGFAQQAANAIRYSRLVERRQKDMLARERLQRLLPAEVVEEVMLGERDLARGGEQRSATVLFADIRGFTSLSERIGARKIVDLLNDYFEHMVEVIFEYGGALDKFVGDEIMAVWGAHVEVEDHAWMATCAALEMQKRLASYNEVRRAAGKIEVHMGIGLNTGDLIAGYMGSSRAMNHTVIGDVVNVAARLCSVAPADAVFVSRNVRDEVGERVELIQEPSQALKGKSQSVEIYRAIRPRQSQK